MNLPNRNVGLPNRNVDLPNRNANLPNRNSSEAKIAQPCGFEWAPIYLYVYKGISL